MQHLRVKILYKNLREPIQINGLLHDLQSCVFSNTEKF